MELSQTIQKRLTVSELNETQRALVADAVDVGSIRPPEDPSVPSEVFLTGLSVEGFRGIGHKVTVPFSPGAGLTVITGRNGSGKSSLAESIELLLTGDNARWADKKSSDLRKGWKNLHHKGETKIEVDLTSSGSGMITLSRQWPDDTLDVGVSMVKRPGKDPTPIASLGWSQALKTYRPFLSYGELGGLIEDGPSRLHDAIANILGLEEFTQIKEVLTAKKSLLSAQIKETKASWTPLLTELEALADPRASAVVAATKKRGWGPSAIEGLLSVIEVDNASVAGWCRNITETKPIPHEPIMGLVDLVRTALAAVEALEGSDAQTALATATLLEQAIALHRSIHLPDCPVCGSESVLDARWLVKAEADVVRLQAEATSAKAAIGQLGVAERQLRQALPGTPPILAQWPADLDESIRMLAYELGKGWEGATQKFQTLELTALLPDAASVASETNERLGELQAQASLMLESADSEWTALARKLRVWCVRATELGDVDAQLKDVTAAESWVVALSNEVRDERLAPIRASVESVWNDLRCDSNISLANFELDGRGTRRRVDVSLTVDDTPAPTLGVLSQGEMHALALSMFLPRAALDQSPFRFLVIDDPVQAMDPSKVDGLARQLAKVAKTRQVIVLTHDDRLPEALRRLDIGARVLEVIRGTKSGVRVETSLDPTERRLKAARDLTKDKNLPTDICQQVVAAQCRQAIEAECVDLVRIRMIRGGRPTAQVDEALDDANTLNDYLGLAVMQDRKRADEATLLVEQAMPGARNLVFQIQGATHGDAKGSVGDFGTLIEDTRKLVKALRAMVSP
jgi:energy-coupling factor transporter ATP-binding protein EcfA2